MSDFNQLAQDYQRIAQAINYLELNFQEQPSLEEIATTVHLSPYHFHRLFKRWAGITPKQFLQFLTIDYAKRRLVESASVLETSCSSVDQVSWLEIQPPKPLFRESPPSL